ncbi:MAG: hypothetical protein K2Z80_11650 [Xanthobacteraceae bacterium]|nr:hypothetical protein [Xanthobacteraceae bacterium]
MAPGSLKEAVRQTRIEVAERSAVVVDLRDAELARLELLNEALDPLFKDVPPDVDLFDRGISRGDVPRLWIDAIAHVVMGRDKRRYRFVQDTRYGRKVLAESNEIADIVKAATHYVALRLIERERALAADTSPALEADGMAAGRGRWRTVQIFLLGLIVGSCAVFAVLWAAATRLAD